MITFKLLAPYRDWLWHGILERDEGDFNDASPDFERDLAALMDRHDLPRPVYAEQVHGKTVLALRGRPKALPQADGFATDAADLPLMIKVADCQAAFLVDPEHRAAAAIHSGWRGSAQNILGEGVRVMREGFGSRPEVLRVGIGPSLGPCCAEFSDPLQELPEAMHPFVKGRKVDLWALSLHQLAQAGVRGENMEALNLCTRCHPERFYSYRRGDAGRLAAVLALQTL